MKERRNILRRVLSRGLQNPRLRRFLSLTRTTRQMTHLTIPRNLRRFTKQKLRLPAGRRSFSE